MTQPAVRSERDIQLLLDFLSCADEEAPEAAVMETGKLEAGEEAGGVPAWSEKQWVLDRIAAAGSPCAVLLRRTRSVLSLVRAGDYRSGRRDTLRVRVLIDSFLPDPELLRSAGIDPLEYLKQERWTGWERFCRPLEEFRRRGMEVIVPPSVSRWLASRLPEVLSERLALDSGVPADMGQPFDLAHPGMTFVFRPRNKSAFNGFEPEKMYVVGERKSVISAGSGNLSIRISLHRFDESCSEAGSVVGEVSDAMEGWFNESFEPTVQVSAIYQEKNLLKTWRASRLEAERRKLASLNLPLFDHVFNDTAEAALRDRVLFCNPPRMGKTSQMIAFALLKQARKVLVICVKNGRRVFLDEFRRLGVPERDVVVVDSLEDLEKPGRFYLVTYSWLRGAPERVSVKNRSKVMMALKTGKGFRDRTLCRPSKGTAFPSLYNSLSKAFSVNGFSVASARLVGRKNSRAPVLWKDVSVVRSSRPMTYPFLEYGLSVLRPKQNGARLPDAYHSIVHYELAGMLQFMRVVQHSDGLFRVWRDDRAGTEDAPFILKRIQLENCSASRADWIRRKMKFDAVLVDEIHHIRNSSTLQSQAVFKIRAKVRAGASGTLTVNTPLDVFIPLCWLLDGPSTAFPYRPKPVAKDVSDKKQAFKEDSFSSEAGFSQSYISYVSRETGEFRVTQGGKTVAKTKRVTTPFLKRPFPFWDRIRAPWIMRRPYSDDLVVRSLEKAGLGIPPMQFNIELLDPHPDQKRLMMATLHQVGSEFAELSGKLQAEQTKEAKAEIQEALRSRIFGYIRLLKTVASAPGLLVNAGVRYEGPFGGGKEHRIRQIAEDWSLLGRKLLVISDIPQLRDYLGEMLSDLGSIVFQTSWDDDRRTEAFEEFNNNDDIHVFVCGPRSVNESVDLSIATRVVTTDLMWSPAPMIQCWSRVRTPKPVPDPVENNVLLTRHSIDVHIRNVFYSKVFSMEQMLDHRVLSSDDTLFDLHKFMQQVLSERSFLEPWEVEREVDELAFRRPVFDSLSQIVVPEDVD